MAFIFGFTPRQQVRDFVRQMTDLGSKRIPRAIQFALNGVAIDAAKRAPAVIQQNVDRPTPWSTRTFFAKKGKLSGLTGKGLDQQSAIFKYLMGDDPEQTRRPGDVGLAKRSIMLPVWANLKPLGIKPNARGNVPKTALAKIFANVEHGAFYGRPVIMGKRRGDGLWARPGRIWVTEKGDRWRGRDRQGRFTKDVRPEKGAKMKRAYAGIPKQLFVAVPFTKHVTFLQRPVERMAGKAMSTMGSKLTQELASEIGRRGGLASVAARRAAKRQGDR